jgi:chemotaxis protein MotB
MRRRRFNAGDDAGENFWPSFTDLISTVALILFVIVLLAYIQNLLAGKKLEYMRAQLDDTHRRLETSQLEISRSERRLKLLEDDLDRTMAEIEEGQTRLTLSEQRVAEQQTIIAESNRELGNLRSKLQGIAVLRLEVLSKVKRSLEQGLGTAGSGRAPPVSIADNGNIVIGEKLVFEYNSHAIKKEGKPLLDMLSRAFEHVLADPAVRDHVDVILVQGHTDTRGSSSYNRELSARRANAVLSYMFESNRVLERDHGSLFASSAYSEFRPLRPGAHDENRRIEISVVLKDSGVRKTIDDYMRGVNPLLAPPGAPR